MKKSTLTRCIVVAIIGIAVFSLPSTQAAGGFFIRILPDASQDWSNNTKMWIVAPQGESVSRRFTVSNTSDKRISVDLKFGGAKIVNGLISYDKDANLKSETFAKFSENPVQLQPGDQKIISVSFSAPSDIESYSEDGFLIASVGGKKSSGEGRIQVVVPTVYQYAYPMFVGVGSFSDFKSDFEILDVASFNDSVKGHALKVYLKNVGKVPITLKGDVSFQDATFGGPILGPFPFATSRISPGQTAYAVVELPLTITESSWKIYTKANIGVVTKTRTFVKDISFSGISLLTRLVQALMIIASLLGLLWAWKVFRSPAPVQEKERRPLNRRRRALTSGSAELKSQLDVEAEEIVAKLIAQVQAQSERKLKASKKKSAPTSKVKAKTTNAVKKSAPKRSKIETKAKAGRSL
jgi:hypothetical protein